ncbi:suppressor of tumorigenicity 14 protein homolog isoform X1 [Argopecten irradians]|uniref:suppressor of tumorigenicity 14 protein homolog isoform X1 n=1 Tax=Argopecten irradians TaxID=31199 RepID=UPI003723DC73
MEGQYVYLALGVMSMWLWEIGSATALVTGIDRGTTSCFKIHDSVKIAVEKGDFGYISSFDYPDNYTVNHYHGHNCNVEIRACSTCRLRLELVDVHFPECPSHRKTRHRNLCLPGCDHVQIHEVDKPYNGLYRRNYHSDDTNATYESISSSVRIRHCMSNGTGETGKRFRIKYQVIEKREMRTGSVSSVSSDPVDGGHITSPNFPNGYALNEETFTYTIHNLDPYGHIRLTFDDWHIASVSQIQIYDGLHTSSPSMVFGKQQRPLLVSESNTVIIVFNTGKSTHRCCQHIGFKATYQFVSEKRWDKMPSTNCSSFIPAKTGGKLEIGHAFPSLPGVYDCIWIIRRPTSKHMQGLLLRLTDYSLGNGWLDVGSNTLDIHDGLTSVDHRISRFVSTNLTMGSWLSNKEGFYIRIRGTFYPEDGLTFVYTAVDNVTDDGCPKKADYLCSNLWCIDRHLTCDGVDHCGDNSDESPEPMCSISKLWKIELGWSLPPQPSTTLDPCSGGFHCRNNYLCIPISNICDGVYDCDDRSDEIYCAYYKEAQAQNGVQVQMYTNSLVMLILMLQIIYTKLL